VKKISLFAPGCGLARNGRSGASRQQASRLVHIAENLRLHPPQFEAPRLHSADTILVQADDQRAAARNAQMQQTSNELSA
jgi:hypothetical protein